MKNWLLAVFIFMIHCGIAQQRTNDNLQLAMVNDWNKISYRVTEDFWSSVKQDIVNQIGAAGFENVKKFSAQNLPIAFRMWDDNRAHKKVSLEEYFKRLSSLKVYKYIQFSRVNGKGERVQYWILSVPYQELYWDKTTKWDSVYILIKAAAVDDKPQIAIVYDWNKISYQVNEDFWNSAKQGIVSQIGTAEFEKVKKWSAQNLPDAFRMWDGDRTHKKISLEEYFKRLSSLKVYKYIPFTRVNLKGEQVKHWILTLPYQELYWDKTTKWDTVYIIIKAVAVE